MPTHALPDGGQLAYEDAGRGTPIVLLHDAAEDAGALAPLIERLQSIGRVIAPHLRAADDPARVVRNVGHLMTHLPAAPAVVIGTGTGAAAALLMAVERPDLVDRVVADSPPFALTPVSRLGDVFCHVFLIWGETDPTLTVEHKMEISLAVPRARRLDLPCGHRAYALARDAFLEAVQDHVTETVPAAKLPANEERPLFKAVEFDV